MKTIIVPTDFTAVSSNAARYAISLAAQLHTSVTLFHSYPIPMALSEVPTPPQVFNALQRDAEEFLENAKKDLGLVTPPNVEIKTDARPGTFLTGLQQLCNELEPEAIVISSHGRAGVEHLVMGSETAASVTHLRWPLIVVPRGAKFKAPQHIAIACDLLKVHSTVPVNMIRKLVETFKADLSVLHVHNKQSYSEAVIEGTGDLQEMLADLHPSYHFIENADVTEAVLDFVDHHNIDLLIAFPKKHNLLQSLFRKSESKIMAKETLVPLMTVHEK
ncbi:MAG: hypothetical protein DI535_17820 [Citrobacter freundii]|nr:MAG: hypothetical protein DI535_17820 [Citrobacter freundii]